MIDDTVEGYVDGATEGFPEEWDLDALWTALKHAVPGLASPARSSRTRPAASTASTATTCASELEADAQAAYDAREEELGSEVMRELERRVLLSVLDRKWREHLYEMDYLREGIGLRAYSQRDPLVEYQREGFDLFHAMMDSIKEESVGFLFNVEVEVEAEEEPEEFEAHPGRRRRDRVGEPAGRPRRLGPARAAHLRQGARRAEAAAPTSPTPLRARTARPRCVGRR